MSNGIVVEGKESGVRYALREENFDPETEIKVRDLKPGETILGYQPKQATPKGDTAPTNLDESAGEAGTPSTTEPPATTPGSKEASSKASKATQ